MSAIWGEERDDDPDDWEGEATITVEGTEYPVIARIVHTEPPHLPIEDDDWGRDPLMDDSVANWGETTIRQPEYEVDDEPDDEGLMDEEYEPEDEDEVVGDTERCDNCVYCIDMRPDGTNDCNMFPPGRGGQGRWWSTSQRPSCGSYKRGIPQVPHKFSGMYGHTNQMRMYNPM